MGTPEAEAKQRMPMDAVYTELGKTCSDTHVSVDYFLMAADRDSTDVFSTGEVLAACCGRVHRLPSYIQQRDGPRLHAAVMRILTRPTAWEGVGRIRCSEGLRCVLSAPGVAPVSAATPSNGSALSHPGPERTRLKDDSMRVE